MRWCLRFPFHSEEGRVLAYHYQERGHKYGRQKESGWSYAIADSSKVFHAQLTIHVTKWKTDDSQMTFRVAYNLSKNLSAIEKRIAISFSLIRLLCLLVASSEAPMSSNSRFVYTCLSGLYIFFYKNFIQPALV